MIRVGSLCTGYGGLELGLEMAGIAHELVFVADPNPAVKWVLDSVYPDVPNYGDISLTDWAFARRVDVLTMGFPCQDVSLAGRRAGMVDGSRSGLWWECRRAIVALRPRLVVIENVRGLLSAKATSDMEQCPACLAGGADHPSLRALGAVLGDLASIGYDARWVTLPASAVGAAHKRERVFVAAWPGGEAQPRLGQWREAAADAQGDGHGDARSEEFGGLPPAAVSGDLRGVPQEVDRLLPTPRTSDANGGGQHGDGGLDLRTVVTLLPTPAAARSGRNRSASAGAAVRPSLDQVDALLPTPKHRDWKGIDPNPRGGDINHALSLLPTPKATDGTKGGPNQRGSSGDLTLPSAVQPERWGRYAAAIHRWETIMGRPAPEPTMANRNNNPALDPRFVEWLMGLPAGRVTSLMLPKTDPRPDKISRNDALRILGNGVVPHQVAAAVAYLLTPLEDDVQEGTFNYDFGRDAFRHDFGDDDGQGPVLRPAVPRPLPLPAGGAVEIPQDELPLACAVAV